MKKCLTPSVIDVMSPDLTNWLKVTCRDMSCHIYVTRSESAFIRGGTRCCVDDMTWLDDTTASDCGCRLFRAETICARMLSWNKCLVWWINCWWRTRKQGKGNWRWEPTRCTFEGVLKTCLVMCNGSFVDVFWVFSGFWLTPWDWGHTPIRCLRGILIEHFISRPGFSITAIWLIGSLWDLDRLYDLDLRLSWAILKVSMEISQWHFHFGKIGSVTHRKPFPCGRQPFHQGQSG